jgi:hypothetical protein
MLIGMTKPTGFGHLRLAETDQPAPGPLSEPSAKRLALTGFDVLAATAFAGGDTSDLVEHVRGLAEALCGPERDEVRLRTISRALATERAHQQLLETMLGNAVAKRDHEAVDLIERVLKSVTARVVALMQEHRIECGLGRRNVLVVGHADSVTVQGG